MRIFLTGATGFIGKHLVGALKHAGYFVETDMREFDCKHYHRVIHLAAKTTISAEFDAEMFEANIVLAKKIMQTPCKVIYASSCSAAHLTNPYAYTKRFTEYLGGLHGNAVGLRFHNVYGPSNNKGIVKFLMSQESGARITVRGPKLIRDYIYVADAVKAIMWNVENDFTPGMNEVGTGVGTKTIDLVDLFMKLSGKGFQLDFAEHGVNEPPRMVADGKFLYSHTIPLEEGLKKTLEYEKVYN